MTRARLSALLAVLVASSSLLAVPAAAQTAGAAVHSSCDCSPLTLAKTVPIGSDRTLLVSVAMIAGSQNLTSVTYNGSAMTQIGSAEHNGNARIYLYERKLGTGAAVSSNVVVTPSGGAAKMVVGAQDFTGVSQTQSLTATGAFGKSRVASVTRPGVANGQVVIDAIAMKSVPSPSLIVGTGQTLLWSRDQSSNGTGAQSRKPHSGATGSVTVSYDKGNNNTNEWAMLATTLTAATPPSISLTKSTTSTFTAAGDSLTYNFTVTNTGAVTVTNVSVSDPLISGAPIAGCTTASLAAGATQACSATYTATQADLEVGKVVNTASATSTETGAVSSNTLEVAFTGTVTKTLKVVKSSTSAFTAAGVTLAYDFSVENTGNVTLNTISLSDPLVSSSPVPACAALTLAPGAKTTCSGSYTTTQADVDAGKVVNTATASSTETGPVDSNTLTLSYTGPATTSLDVTKSTASVFSAAGETLTYHFTVKNAGTLTLTNISLSDPLVSSSPIAACAASTLAPGDKTTCTGSYTTTQPDVDAGKVVNTATASSTETGSVASNAVTLMLTGSSTPALSVTKSSSSMFSSVGALLVFDFVVENTGIFTLNDVSLTDALIGSSPIAGCTAASLAPGAKTTCSATYTATQGDVDAGQVVNTANATSTETGTVASNSVTLSFAGVAGPAIAVVKSSSSAFTGAGVTLAYDFVVQNTGNVTLTKVMLSDSLVSESSLAPCAAMSLAPGAKTTCSATYTTTADDVAAGQVVNTATGTSVQTGDVASNTVTLTLKTKKGTPSLSAVASSSSQFTAAGVTLTYQYIVENTGDLPLTGLKLRVPLAGGAPIAGCSIPALAPGEQATCSVAYATVQADVDAGQVTSPATIESVETGSGAANTVTIPYTGEVVRQLAITLASSASTFSGSGQTVRYEVAVENVGTITLADVSASLSLAEGTLADCAAASLAPGARTTCALTYTTRQADVDAGQVTGQAHAAAASAGSAASNTVVVTYAADAPAAELRPAMSVSVTSSETIAVPGATLTYVYTVENTGNVALTNVAVTTSLSPAPVAGCSAESLAPGATLTCTVLYTATDADLKAGRIEHVATASSTETGAVTSGVLVAMTIDEERVRESAADVSKTFLMNRLNGILFSEPDAHRLINREQSGSGSGPLALTGAGDQNRMNLAWGTSLRRIRQASARNTEQVGARAIDGPHAGNRFDVWFEGTYYRHSRTLANGRERGEVGLAYSGIDYTIGNNVLVGVLTQFDWSSASASGPETLGLDKAEGFGWMAGPYVSARLGGVLVDVRGAWGRSDNDIALQVSGIDFESTFRTSRRLVRATISGETVIDRFRVRPTTSVAYMQDAQHDYLARSSRADVFVTGMGLALGRVTAGPEMSYRFTPRAGGHVEPFFAPSLVWDVQQERATAFDPFRRVGDSKRGAMVTGVRFMLKRAIAGDAVVGIDGLGDQGFSGTSLSTRVVIPF